MLFRVVTSDVLCEKGSEAYILGDVMLVQLSQPILLNLSSKSYTMCKTQYVSAHIKRKQLIDTGFAYCIEDFEQAIVDVKDENKTIQGAASDIRSSNGLRGEGGRALVLKVLQIYKSLF